MKVLSCMFVVVMARLASATVKYNDLAILSPAGKDIVQVRHLQRVQWTPGSQVKCVRLELCSGPSQNLFTESVIAKSITNSGSFMWTVPDVDTSKVYAIRISDTGNKNLTNYSPQFRIHDTSYQFSTSSTAGSKGFGSVRSQTSAVSSTSTGKTTYASKMTDMATINGGSSTKTSLSLQRNPSPFSRLRLASTISVPSRTFQCPLTSGTASTKHGSKDSLSSNEELLTSATESLVTMNSPSAKATNYKAPPQITSSIITGSAHQSTTSGSGDPRNVIIREDSTTRVTNGANLLSPGVVQFLGFLSIAVLLY